MGPSTAETLQQTEHVPSGEMTVNVRQLQRRLAEQAQDPPYRFSNGTASNGLS
jgi:hypothetical protein